MKNFKVSYLTRFGFEAAIYVRAKNGLEAMNKVKSNQTNGEIISHYEEVDKYGNRLKQSTK